MRPTALLFSLLLIFLSACDDGQNAQKSAAFYADPEAFIFSQLQAGQSETRQVRIRNLGRVDLKLSQIQLEDHSTQAEFKLQAAFNDVQGPLEAHYTLSPEKDSLLFSISYTPLDSGDDSAVLHLKTNDPEALDVQLPVTTRSQGAELFVSPTSIDFGTVNAGEIAQKTVTLTNLGASTLIIESLTLNGSSDFSLVASDAGFFEDVSLETGQKTQVIIQYAPLTLGSDQGELLIRSNDAFQPVRVVDLRSNGAAPCLRAPAQIDFGLGLISSSSEPSNQKALSISSCGNAALNIYKLSITDPNGVFSVLSDSVSQDGSPLATLPAATETEASRDFMLGFAPAAEQSYGGWLTIDSNDPASPHRIELFGRGSQNACPIPKVTQTQFDVTPLDIITLDASPSYDPGGQVVRYVWTVVSRPEGSVSQVVESYDDLSRPADGGPLDDETTSRALFFVDLAGDYQLELKVYDNLGQVSCSPYDRVTIEVHAVPQKDLHVQLVWSTPDDPDETDRIGTDVDLHLRHQNAGDLWSAHADMWDCYFNNKTPDWGILNDVTDNPTLDIDDKNGAGPENINLANPEADHYYDIGALYFNAFSTFGIENADPRTAHTSYATVRIFIKGSLLAEFVDQPLTENRQLWWVARLNWCEDPLRCPTIEERGEMLSEAEY